MDKNITQIDNFTGYNIINSISRFSLKPNQFKKSNKISHTGKTMEITNKTNRGKKTGGQNTQDVVGNNPSSDIFVFY